MITRIYQKYKPSHIKSFWENTSIQFTTFWIISKRKVNKKTIVGDNYLTIDSTGVTEKSTCDDWRQDRRTIISRDNNDS